MQQIIWSLLAASLIFVGGSMLAASQSSQHEIEAIGAFGIAAICATNAILADHFSRVRKHWKAKPEQPENKPAVATPIDSEILATLTAIRSELQWQRQQKEKEIHRAKAAQSTRPSS